MDVVDLTLTMIDHNYPKVDPQLKLTLMEDIIDNKCNLVKLLKTPQSTEVLVELLDNLDLATNIKFLLTAVIPLMYEKGIDNLLQNSVIRIAFKLIETIKFKNLNEKQQDSFLQSLNKYTDALSDFQQSNNPNWYQLWIFLPKFLETKLHTMIGLSNKLLRVTERAFRNSDSIEQRLKAYDCWRELIDNWSLNLSHIISTKRMKLLLTPLIARMPNSRMPIVIIKRFETFLYLMKKLQNRGEVCLGDFLNYCFEPFDDDSSSNDKLKYKKNNPEIAEKSTKILMELIGVSKKENSIIGLEEPLVNASNFSKFMDIILKSIWECCYIMKDWNNEETVKEVIQSLWERTFYIVHQCSNDVKEKFYNLFLEGLKKNLNKLERTLGNKLTLNYLLIVILNQKETIKNENYKKAVFLLGVTQLFSHNDLGCEILILLDKYFNSCFESKETEGYSKILIEFYNDDPKWQNIKGMSDLWLKCNIYSNENQKDLFNFLLWPMYHTDICETPEHCKKWKSIFNEHCNTENIISAIFSELKTVFNKQPLLSKFNLLWCLELITSTKVSISGELGKRLFELILQLVSSDLYEAHAKRIINVLVSCVSKGNLFELNEKIIEKLSKSVKHVLNEKDYTILDDLYQLFSKSDQKHQKRYCKYFLPIMEDLMLLNEMPEMAPKLIVLLQAVNEPKVNSFSRSLRIMNAVEKEAKEASSKTPKPKTSFKRTRISLIDEKSNDFVKIDTVVKVNTENLNEHQKEVMIKRRDDIPALYNDLSQSSRSNEINSHVQGKENLQSEEKQLETTRKKFETFNDRPRRESPRKKETDSPSVTEKPQSTKETEAKPLKSDDNVKKNNSPLHKPDNPQSPIKEDSLKIVKLSPNRHKDEKTKDQLIRSPIVILGTQSPINQELLKSAKTSSPIKKEPKDEKTKQTPSKKVNESPQISKIENLTEDESSKRQSSRRKQSSPSRLDVIKKYFPNNEIKEVKVALVNNDNKKLTRKNTLKMSLSTGSKTTKHKRAVRRNLSFSAETESETTTQTKLTTKMPKRTIQRNLSFSNEDDNKNEKPNDTSAVIPNSEEPPPAIVNKTKKKENSTLNKEEKPNSKTERKRKRSNDLISHKDEQKEKKARRSYKKREPKNEKLESGSNIIIEDHSVEDSNNVQNKIDKKVEKEIQKRKPKIKRNKNKIEDKNKVKIEKEKGSEDLFSSVISPIKLNEVEKKTEENTQKEQEDKEEKVIKEGSSKQSEDLFEISTTNDKVHDVNKTELNVNEDIIPSSQIEGESKTNDKDPTKIDLRTQKEIKKLETDMVGWDQLLNNSERPKRRPKRITKDNNVKPLIQNKHKSITPSNSNSNLMTSESTCGDMLQEKPNKDVDLIGSSQLQLEIKKLEVQSRSFNELSIDKKVERRPSFDDLNKPNVCIAPNHEELMEFSRNMDKILSQKCSKESESKKINIENNDKSSEGSESKSDSLKMCDFSTATLIDDSKDNEQSTITIIEEDKTDTVNLNAEEVKNRNIVTSPITCFTPDKNKELLNNTEDISPITKVAQEDEQEKSKKKSNNFNNTSGRSRKLLNMVNLHINLTPQGNILKKRRQTILMSPSTNRTKRLMSNFNEEPPNTSKNDNNCEILTFTKEIPSPLMAPKRCILKRKLDCVDEATPSPKRKRVNFSDPITTQKRIYIKEEESIQMVSRNEAIFPNLLNCQDSIACILDDISSPKNNSSLKMVLDEKKITSIKDLAQLSPAQINKIPFIRSPKASNVTKALLHHYLQKEDNNDTTELIENPAPEFLANSIIGIKDETNECSSEQPEQIDDLINKALALKDKDLFLKKLAENFGRDFIKDSLNLDEKLTADNCLNLFKNITNNLGADMYKVLSDLMRFTSGQLPPKREFLDLHLEILKNFSDSVFEK